MYNSGLLRQKFKELGVSIGSAADPQSIVVYKAALEEMSDLLLNTDARKFSRAILDVLITDLTEIIKYLSMMRHKPASRDIRSLDALISMLRDSRTELYVASDMAESKKTQSFYRCINKAGDQISSALMLFR